MTDRTSVLGIRLENEIKDAISKYLTRVSFYSKDDCVSFNASV